MILPDVSIWIYAHRADAEQHAAYSDRGFGRDPGLRWSDPLA